MIYGKLSRAGMAQDLAIGRPLIVINSSMIGEVITIPITDPPLAIIGHVGHRNKVDWIPP